MEIASGQAEREEARSKRDGRWVLRCSASENGEVRFQSYLAGVIEDSVWIFYVHAHRLAMNRSGLRWRARTHTELPSPTTRQEPETD